MLLRCINIDGNFATIAYIYLLIISYNKSKLLFFFNEKDATLTHAKLTTLCKQCLTNMITYRAEITKENLREKTK